MNSQKKNLKKTGKKISGRFTSILRRPGQLVGGKVKHGGAGGGGGLPQHHKSRREQDVGLADCVPQCAHLGRQNEGTGSNPELSTI